MNNTQVFAAVLLSLGMFGVRGAFGQSKPGALPKSVLAKPSAPENTITIELTKGGVVVLGGRKMPINGLGPSLERKAKAMRAEGKDPTSFTLVIRADAAVRTGNVQELIKICQDLGFDKFALRAKLPAVAPRRRPPQEQSAEEPAHEPEPPSRESDPVDDDLDSTEYLEFGPKASFAIALHYAKNDQWKKYFAFSLHSAEGEQFKRMIAERGEEAFFEMYKKRKLPRMVTIYNQIRDKNHVPLMIDKQQCALFVLDPPVTSAYGILMYKDGDHFTFRNSSPLSDVELQELQKKHAQDGTASPAPDAVGEKDFGNLSKRFLAALRSGKTDECMACWVSVERMKQLVEKPPRGLPVPPPEEIGNMIKYFQERDKVIEKSFPKIIAALTANGANPKDLTYVSSDGQVRKRGDFEATSNVDAVFRCPDGTLAQISIDDGMKLDGKWYFSDKPHLYITFTKDGKQRTVVIDD